MKISQFIKRQQSERAPEYSVQEQLQSYSKMSEEDLLSRFFAQANKEKANGTLDKNALENFYQQASPMLTPEQRAKMRDLIDRI